MTDQNLLYSNYPKQIFIFCELDALFFAKDGICLGGGPLKLWYNEQNCQKCLEHRDNNGRVILNLNEWENVIQSSPTDYEILVKENSYDKDNVNETSYRLFIPEGQQPDEDIFKTAMMVARTMSRLSKNADTNHIMADQQQQGKKNNNV